MVISLSKVITHTHNTSLALAAIAVSIVAATTGLVLTKNIRILPESRRKAVIVMAAFLLGGGIWSMHFLAMLAIEFPVPIHYDMLQTLGSGLIAVLVVGFALLLLHFRKRTPTVIRVAGVCLGMGIISMHVVGMLGMRGVIPEFNTGALFIAFALAPVMGVAAVRISYGDRSRVNIVKGGVIFGLSVVVVHFTAMIGTHFTVDPDYQKPSIALDQGALAIAVTVAVFVICGTFLLAAATFVPSTDSTVTARIDNAHTVDGPLALDNSITSGKSEVQISAMLANPLQTDDPPSADSEREMQTHVGEVDRHALVEKEQAAGQGEVIHSTEGERSAELSTLPTGHIVPVKVPYEQQKQIFFVDSTQVGAIRADGRYTQLYTHEGVKFCPWSITEAEKRLAGTRFYRSHRSYLINLIAVASFEKNRDSGVCRFEGFTQLANVPVSRSRVGELVAELGL